MTFRYHAKGTRDYIKMKENEASTSAGNTKQSKKKHSAKRKEKPPPPHDTSWFWSKYKRQKDKKGVPNVSAGIQETFTAYSTALGKFLRGGRATKGAEYQPLDSDDNGEETIDTDDDDSQNLGFGQKIKNTGSRIFDRIQSNEHFRNFKTRVRDNPVFTRGRNTPQNTDEG